MDKNADKLLIERFSPQIRLSHWVHVTSFLMLIITGLPIFTDSLSFIFGIFGGADNTKALHRFFGIIFVLPTLFMLLFDRRGFTHWTKSVLKWKRNDIAFFKEYPKKLLGMKASVPKQGFFNAGQKVNSLLTIALSALMFCSGMIMWHKGYFPDNFVRWLYPLHSAAAVLMASVVLGHAYMSVLNPESRPAIRGMIKGNVDSEYAKSHHGLWYDEVTEKDK